MHNQTAASGSVSEES